MIKLQNVKGDLEPCSVTYVRVINVRNIRNM